MSPECLSGHPGMGTHMMNGSHGMATRGQPDRVGLVESSSLEKDQRLLQISLGRRYTCRRVRLQRIDSPRPVWDLLPTAQPHRHDRS